MDKNSGCEKLNRIEKRAIEAQAVIPVIEAVARRYGREEAMAILQQVNEQEAYQRGRNSRNREGDEVIAKLANDVATWGEGGSWEMEVLEQTPTTYFFNVTRCPYYEKYCDLGLNDYGPALSCCRDEPFARGLAPGLKLVRTQTIMEGAACCDFRYYLVTDDLKPEG